MKRLLACLAFVVLLAPIGSCVFVTDDHCPEGAMRCENDLIVECVYDDWEVVQDCWYLCGGYCAFDYRNNPVCIC